MSFKKKNRVNRSQNFNPHIQSTNSFLKNEAAPEMRFYLSPHMRSPGFAKVCPQNLQGSEHEGEWRFP